MVGAQIDELFFITIIASRLAWREYEGVLGSSHGRFLLFLL